jgi:hypothetical protein
MMKAEVKGRGPLAERESNYLLAAAISVSPPMIL